MADEQDPPRKIYQLKPREFERVNPPASAAAPELSVDAAADTSPPPAAPVDLRHLIRQGATNAPLLSGNAAANRANDVHAMLAGNLQRANAAGLNAVPLPPPRRSKRKRDYLLTMALGNGVLGAALLLNWGNPIVFVYCIGGMALFTAGLSWIMWQIMSDY